MTEEIGLQSEKLEACLSGTTGHQHVQFSVTDFPSHRERLGLSQFAEANDVKVSEKVLQHLYLLCCCAPQRGH